MAGLIAFEILLKGAAWRTKFGMNHPESYKNQETSGILSIFLDVLVSKKRLWCAPQCEAVRPHIVA